MASGPAVPLAPPGSARRQQLRAALSLPALPGPVALACREATPDVTDRIAGRIRTEVEAFAGEADATPSRRLRSVVHLAVSVFVDALSGAPTTGAEVLDLYWRIGRSHARSGRSIDALRAAHHIASQETWDGLRAVSADLGVDSTRLLQLADALRAYQGALLEHAVAGSDSLRTPEYEAQLAWRELVTALTLDPGDADLTELAARCSWKLPDQVVVMVTGSLDDGLRFEQQVVVASCNNRSFVIVDAVHADEVLAGVMAHSSSHVALSWPVDARDSFRASRWASRTLDLLGDAIDEPSCGRLIRCCEHQSVLSMYADPVLRHLADRDVLQPLIHEKPKRRAVLAETLMVWLQTRRPSAPALAEQLGVHEQTVRHRLRYLNEMFDEPLDDPTATLGLLAALESATPRWLRAVG